LLTREASRDNSLIDMSWLGKVTLPRTETPGDQARLQPQPAQIPVEPLQHDLAMSMQAELVPSEEAPSAPDSNASGLASIAELTRDIPAIEQRYPLLRNAM
jgi:hypothetical protein